MTRLPAAEENLEPLLDWVNLHVNQITVNTLLSTPVPRPDILVVLVNRLRYRIRRAGSFSIAKPESMLAPYKHTEEALRNEVRNYPAAFNFNPRMLRDYHPIHLAEMLVTVLNMLEAQGIDCRVQSPGPNLN